MSRPGEEKKRDVDRESVVAINPKSTGQNHRSANCGYSVRYAFVRGNSVTTINAALSPIMSELRITPLNEHRLLRDDALPRDRTDDAASVPVSSRDMRRLA